MKKIIIIIVGLLLLGSGLFLYYQKSKKTDNTDQYYHNINYQEFNDLISNKKTFVLVVHQTGCPHCEAYLPVIKDIANNYELNVYSINTSELTKDENIKFSQIVRVSGTPSTLFYFDGVEKTSSNRLVGDVKSTSIVNRLKSLGFIEAKND